ncbi:hypothetical protein MLD63_01805 (plasmid) [Paracoccus sp. TK19116]|uniref:Uncharacterized protein n=1 Tax=Paracoccus albicereus TaxID=2922394 RepID=A0ABT1MLL5_9RHOB|nr:hypothetical protein [Paracoccus albicereus]MCQ0969170.1 hypothetical protein [Paracoccus albicereus]
MIGGLVERRKHWLQALVLSLGLHGVGAAAILDVIPSLPRRTDETISLQIEIAPLDVTTGSVGAATLTPAQPVPTAEGEAVMPEQAVPAGADAVTPTQTDILSPAEDLRSVIAPTPVAPQSNATANLPGIDIALAPTTQSRANGAEGSGADAAALDAGLAALIGSIRQQVAEPCLIALPRNVEDGGLRVTLLGEDEARFAPLIEAVDPPQGVALSQQPLLVDARQCPAVNFARAYRSYPVFPLRIALDTTTLAAGEPLTGTISGIADGDTLALLLIDDNGVVQDLTRFFTAGRGSATAFDVPARRAGDPRETAQLLIALTSPVPIETVSLRDGQLAEDVFAALSAEIGDPAAIKIGLASFDLR